MKRITALLLAVLCMLSVCACNNGSRAPIRSAALTIRALKTDFTIITASRRTLCVTMP